MRKSQGSTIMEEHIVFNPKLTKSDRLILETLVADIDDSKKSKANRQEASQDASTSEELRIEATVAQLTALNDPEDPLFEPSITSDLDYDSIDWKRPFNNFVLRPYISIAQRIVRNKVDVIMLTHLLMYFCTSVPSALFLFFWKFTWIHGLLHFLMTATYIGPYTLMMHQHIHQRGILKRGFAPIDHLFPYLLDPLMGHTWNSYFYHHVKHHHVEGNGPLDLSSTIRYQRDEFLHLLHYIGRFYFLIWLELPSYFFSKGLYVRGLKSMCWELGNYTMFVLMFKLNPRATFCVLLLPFFALRLGLMVGNWGQHALVDHDEPDSDYRSSITLIDVASNRYSYNDGYHTSHHLNPMRHWREHPNAFMKGKQVYAANGGLVSIFFFFQLSHYMSA
ncbi:hypothetical protein BX600DRAFT_451736 [Xylariales sp. PMI_506]|nr:hypothetical protein BX600DRAFT_451736 [Xylariales sp. PMI_506]